MRKRKNDVKRGGWSRTDLPMSSYAIDTKQKLKQSDVDDDDDARIKSEAATIAPQDVPRTTPPETEAPRKKSSTTRRVR